MGALHPAISDAIRAFIEAQHLFFVATATAEGRINLSPKGMDSFRVMGANQAAFLNFTGSGNETAAHLLADANANQPSGGRITIMFCSFDAKPKILRLYGRGVAIHAEEAGWKESIALFPHFQTHPGVRQVIRIDVESVLESCGFAVPQYTYVAERDKLLTWAEKSGAEGVAAYQRKRNAISLDGLATRAETEPE
ncbi:pyridoxamine 5'-phosphate oxidase family protein [Magnetofaba australis]|uniref:Putative pyridoxamine 5'-phosphate oxidase-related FMN-binding protein n=1 Tax=Magnetofaba australis IT-1 TaxID=1434232 RepID=A0A1Y2K887_9PROT|nr:pyridoxamine 5'-phosphate oxidase family protein [Magnetofaba australis]OSM06849.1 putative pyridoxamine 5'-phosphate oxidase-related FMN-binding protein [Magnetofaba australis IT-1]